MWIIEWFRFASYTHSVNAYTACMQFIYSICILYAFSDDSHILFELICAQFFSQTIQDERKNPQTSNTCIFIYWNNFTLIQFQYFVYASFSTCMRSLTSLPIECLKIMDSVKNATAQYKRIDGKLHEKKKTCNKTNAPMHKQTNWKWDMWCKNGVTNRGGDWMCWNIAWWYVCVCTIMIRQFILSFIHLFLLHLGNSLYAFVHETHVLRFAIVCKTSVYRVIEIERERERERTKEWKFLVLADVKHFWLAFVGFPFCFVSLWFAQCWLSLSLSLFLLVLSLLVCACRSLLLLQIKFSVEL